MNDHPEIGFRVTTVEVKTKTRPLRTVREAHYKGIKGKTSTIWAWLKWHSNKNTFSEYLDSPAFKWTVKLPDDMYAHHDIEKELEEE